MKYTLNVTIRMRFGYSWWARLVGLTVGGKAITKRFFMIVSSPSLPQEGAFIDLTTAGLTWVQVKFVDYHIRLSEPPVLEVEVFCEPKVPVDFGSNIHTLNQWLEYRLLPGMKELGFTLHGQSEAK